MPAAAARIDPLYAEAARATAAGSKSFYFATRFFPPDLARHAHAVYWFCRHTDDLVDEAPSIDEGASGLNAWEAELRGGQPEQPILKLFLKTVDERSIPVEYALELIAGCRMDLERQRYESFDDLRTFCYRVAATVGLMMCHVIGFRSPGLEAEGKQHAIDLGIAMQITNILRDVGDDLKLGRIYFPAEDLRRFNYSEAELQAATRNEAFRNLMRFEAARARQYYERAMPGIEMLKPEGRFAVEIAARVYKGILREIEKADYDVFTRRAVVPAAEKYWITARAIGRSWLERRRQ